MKMLAKIALVTVVGGAATYAAPGGWLGPDGAGGAVATGMSLTDMLVRVSQLHEEMLNDVRHVQQLALSARREKDLIKLNCLNDKLVEMKPEVNIAEHAQTELTSTRDSAELQVALDGVSQAADQVRALREGAEQCIGKPLLVTESSNDYTHPDIIDHPPVEPIIGDIEPPAYASPVN